MIEDYEVFDAVRRGYSDFEYSDDNEIRNYFADIDADSAMGHVSNIKGILFEMEYVDTLAAKGIEAEIFEATNHPVTDIMIMDGLEVVDEMQLKATGSVTYINETLEAHPDVPVVVTTEVAASFDTDMVIDSGIENAALEDAVTSTLIDEVVNPVSPVSVFFWLFGLPF